MNAPEPLPLERSLHPESSQFSPLHAKVGTEVVLARVTATSKGWEIRCKMGYVTRHHASLGHIVWQVRFGNEVANAREPVTFHQHEWYGAERTYHRHHEGLALAKHKDAVIEVLKRKIWERLKVECAGVAEVMNACKEGMP